MKTIDIVGKVTMYVILALSVILVVLSASDGDPMADGSATGIVISWTIAVLVIGIVGAIVSSLIGVIGDKKGLIRTGIGIVVGVVIILICWALSDSTPLVLPGYEGSENCYPWLNIADTGIFLFYIAAIGAVLTILGSEIYHMIK